MNWVSLLRCGFWLNGRLAGGFNQRMVSRGGMILLGGVMCLTIVSGCDRKPVTTEGKTSDLISVTKEKAENGDADAQYRLGLMFANEDGVPLSPTEAVDWYRKAAEQGHVQAQIHLGECYLAGTGVSAEPAKAARWFMSAAEKGDVASQNRVGAMFDLGLGLPQDPLDASVWYRRAAERGLAEAQSNLGSLYVTGRGVPRDLVEAFKWLSLADKQGYQRDSAKLAEATQELSVAQLAEARRRIASFVATK